MDLLEDVELLIKAFEKVEESLKRLCLHIHDELSDYPCWIDDGVGQLIDDRDKVIYALRHFKPTEGLQPQQTFACVGALGCTKDTLALIDFVNEAKDEFQLSAKCYLAAHAIEQEKDTSIIRRLLALNGYPGIKLKQVYRHIKYLEFHPRRISFCQTLHSLHRSVNRQEAQKALQKIGQGLHIEVQLSKLELLDNKDRLIIHRDIHKIWTANHATFKDEAGQSTFGKMRTSLPIFYVHNKQLPWPIVTFSKKITKHQQTPRADKKIEENPFLSSIKAYRYKRTTKGIND